MPPKKDSGKDAPKQDAFVHVMFILLVILSIIILWSVILDTLIVSKAGSYSALWQNITVWFSRYVWPVITVLSMIISALAAIGIVRTYRKLLALDKEERKIYGPTPESEKSDEPVINKNEKWERILKHINSENASDWRLAVIEADIMLDELLRAKGYHGDTIGDMLKAVDKSDMLTLEAAWEAHKVRNQIAHSGSDYHLNERDAKRVISLFESVFREFKII